jgi:hypothetical protein
MALLAYPDPTTSPLAHLFSCEKREQIASAIDAALLGMVAQASLC